MALPRRCAGKAQALALGVGQARSGLEELGVLGGHIVPISDSMNACAAIALMAFPYPRRLPTRNCFARLSEALESPAIAASRRSSGDRLPILLGNP